MNTRSIGAVLFVVGVILLAVGLNEYDSLGSRLARAIGSGPSNRVLALLAAGGACSVLGLLQMLKK